MRVTQPTQPPLATADTEHLLMTKKEAADMLRIGVRTLEAWVRRSHIPQIKIGTAVRFDKEDVRRRLLTKFRICRNNPD